MKQSVEVMRTRTGGHSFAPFGKGDTYSSCAPTPLLQRIPERLCICCDAKGGDTGWFLDVRGASQPRDLGAPDDLG